MAKLFATLIFLWSLTCFGLGAYIERSLDSKLCFTLGEKNVCSEKFANPPSVAYSQASSIQFMAQKGFIDIRNLPKEKFNVGVFWSKHSESSCGKANDKVKDWLNKIRQIKEFSPKTCRRLKQNSSINNADQ